MDSAHLPPELLADYAEGLLDPAARLSADGHLQACAECRRALEATREYFAEMSGLEPHKAPDRFLSRVHARIESRSPWKRILAVLSSPRFLPVPLAGLAAVLVGVYLVLAPQLGQESAPTVALAQPREKAEDDATAKAGVAREAAPASSPAPAPAPAAAPAPAPEPLAKEVEPPPALMEEPVMAAAKPEPPAKSRAAAKSEASAFNEAEQLQLAEAASNRMASESSGQEGRVDRDQDMVLADAGPRKEEKAAFKAKKAPRSDEILASPAAIAGAPPSELGMAEDNGDIPVRRAGRPAGAKAVAPLPMTTPLPWAPTGYVLKPKPAAGADKVAAEAAGKDAWLSGLRNLGARVLRSETGAVSRYELELPTARLSDLEAHLRKHGDLTPIARPGPGKDPGSEAGKTSRLTLRVEASP